MAGRWRRNWKAVQHTDRREVDHAIECAAKEGIGRSQTESSGESRAQSAHAAAAAATKQSKLLTSVSKLALLQIETSLEDENRVVVRMAAAGRSLATGAAFASASEGRIGSVDEAEMSGRGRGRSRLAWAARGPLLDEMR